MLFLSTMLYECDYVIRRYKMQVYQWLSAAVVFVAVVHLSSANDDKDKKKARHGKLQIGIKKRVDPDKCKIKSRKGDTLHMHYTVSIGDCINVNV